MALRGHTSRSVHAHSPSVYPQKPRMTGRTRDAKLDDMSSPPHGALAPQPLAGDSGAEMLIDRVLPRYDAVRAVHRVIAGDSPTVFRAVLGTDFLDVARRFALVRLLFALRTLGERAISAVRGRDYVPPPQPESMFLRDLPEEGEWVRLGQIPEREIVFGAIGRFWEGETSWQTITASTFEPFEEGGFGKIACCISLRPYGAAATLVSYECRTRATDERSRRRFLRYWRPLAPFIGLVMSSTLRAMEQTASRSSIKALGEQ